MPHYNVRNFDKTYRALVSTEIAGIAPVSRFADILVGKFIKDIVWAHKQIGIPSQEKVDEIIRCSTNVKHPSIPLYFDQEYLTVEDFTIKKAFDLLYADVEFQPATRPMNIIEVCYEPKTPHTMQHYLQAACKHRDENPEDGLVVLLGTDQSEYRFKVMVENLHLSELRHAQPGEVARLYKKAVESMTPEAELRLEAERTIIDQELFEYATNPGCIPDGIASTSMTPLRNQYIRDTCSKAGIVLIPNIDFSPSNLLECLESVVIQNGRYVSGAPVQKVFPFGGLNTKGWIEGIVGTHPNAKLMTTGGANQYSARELMFYGITLIGASAPAKKAAIVKALHRQYVLHQAPKEAWSDFIREASIFATEVHIGRLLRQRELTNQANKDAELNAVFTEVEKAAGK